MNGIVLAALAGAGYLLVKSSSTTKQEADERYQAMLDEIQERLDSVEARNEEEDLNKALAAEANDLSTLVKCKAFAGAVAGYYDFVTNKNTTYSWYLYFENKTDQDLNIRVTWLNVRLFGQVQIDGHEINKVVTVKAGDGGWYYIAHGYEKPIYEPNAIKNNIKAVTGKAYDVTTDDVLAVVTYEVSGVTASITGWEKSTSVYGLCRCLHYSKDLDDNMGVNFAPGTAPEFFNRALEEGGEDLTKEERAAAKNMTVDEYDAYLQEKAAAIKAKLK